ncbi:hypothetical protein ACJX0J_026466, partial [Zea mays]
AQQREHKQIGNRLKISILHVGDTTQTISTNIAMLEEPEYLTCSKKKWIYECGYFDGQFWRWIFGWSSSRNRAINMIDLASTSPRKYSPFFFICRDLSNPLKLY